MGVEDGEGGWEGVVGRAAIHRGAGGGSSSSENSSFFFFVSERGAWRARAACELESVETGLSESREGRKSGQPWTASSQVNSLRSRIPKCSF